MRCTGEFEGTECWSLIRETTDPEQIRTCLECEKGRALLENSPIRGRGKSMAKITVCQDCGQEGPHYAKGLCKSCYQKRLRENASEKPTRKRNNPKSSVGGVKRVHLCFSADDETYLWLEKEANSQLRTLPNLILFTLKNAIRG